MEHMNWMWFYRDVMGQLFLFMKMFGFPFHETRVLSLHHFANKALDTLIAITNASENEVSTVVIVSFSELSLCNGIKHIHPG